MITEKGTLPFGVEVDGITHRDFEIRPQFVRDTVDVFEDPDVAARASRNNQFFAACLFAGRLTRLGELPKEKITPELILDLRQDDYDEILRAGERLEKQETTFRGAAAAVEKDGAGPDEGGAAVS
jgi:hypothetical protein